MNWIAISIPFFTGLMLLEYLVSKQLKKQTHDMHNTMSNIGVGIAERLCDALITGYFFFIYQYLQKNYGVFTIRHTVFTWIFLLLLTDFIWYWYHRLAHEWNIFWAVHVVHHQSEDFNYTVSARITVLQALVRTGFWAILPLLGFPAEMITTMLLIHGLYPFFIHTTLIKDMGILEYVLVTPAHHSVHHASNPEYLDKNYGDVFIIWDKLFGTFKKLDPAIPIQYGLTTPLRSYSFLWQHFHFFIELFIALKHTKGVISKIKLLFQKPDTLSADYRLEAIAAFRIKQTETPFTSRINKYVASQLIILLTSLFLFILFENQVAYPVRIAFLISVLLTLINCGAILEQKKWIFYLEAARLIVLICTTLYYFRISYLILASLCLLLLLVTSFKQLQQRYLQQVYKQ